jgi:superfamily I DNA and/or RNA helicase
VTGADDVVNGLTSFDIIAGTAWLWARQDLRSSIDTLIVDEAGQLSLANVLAVSTSCRNLVLVGDPQQLSQPSKGVHPEGAGATALEHVLGGRRTVPPDRGLLLDRTWRMHPDVCAFISEQVYEGRLTSQDHLDVQRIGGDDHWAGAGLRWVPVRHRGNRTSSLEEIEVIDQIVQALLGRSWVDDKGNERTLGPDDILVVAPYNAQVNRLAAALPSGSRVGTVDSFQGQEAAVAILSMTTSSAEDAPRGMEFLYSTNRINVAVSRARALSIIVASPDLLSAPCSSVGQIRMVNVLCRYAELAREVHASAP